MGGRGPIDALKVRLHTAGGTGLFRKRMHIDKHVHIQYGTGSKSAAHRKDVNDGIQFDTDKANGVHARLSTIAAVFERCALIMECEYRSLGMPLPRQGSYAGDF